MLLGDFKNLRFSLKDYKCLKLILSPSYVPSSVVGRARGVFMLSRSHETQSDDAEDHVISIEDYIPYKLVEKWRHREATH